MSIAAARPSSTPSPQQPNPDCESPLMNVAFLKRIFYHLLADQKEALRHLGKHVPEQKVKVFSPYSVREKPKKELVPVVELQGLNNMKFVRRVCQTWNRLVLDNQDFHFLLIFTKAKQLMANYQPSSCLGDGGERKALIEIIKVESLYDPDSALSTLAKLKNLYFQRVDEDVLLPIVQNAISMNKPTNAKTMAGAITDLSVKISALCEVAKIEPQALVEAKAILTELPPYERNKPSLEIAKIEALQNHFADAIVTLNEIDKRYSQRSAFRKIAKAAAQHDLKAVKAWAAQLEDPILQALVYLNISFIEQDAISASKWLNLVQNGMNSEKKARAYIKIAKLDRSLGYEQAKKYIHSLRIGLTKVQLLIKLAKLDENPNFNDAKEVAALAPFSLLPHVNFHNCDIDAEEGGDHQYYVIALAEAKYNEKDAHATADKIVDAKLKANTKLNIEIERGNIEKEHALANPIPQPMPRNNRSLFGFDAPSKRTILENVWNSIAIACKDPLHDVRQVKALVGSVSSRFKRVKIICAIAKIVLGDYLSPLGDSSPLDDYSRTSRTITSQVFIYTTFAGDDDSEG